MAVNVPPEIEAGPLITENDTGKPDVAVAESDTVSPMINVLIEAKAIDCDAGWIVSVPPTYV
ncbi:MAG TPA: hypothetical protein VEA63_11600, partial [Opitutus sp.]|nr:hypothetical protein [Opitutus sp.]